MPPRPTKRPGHPAPRLNDEELIWLRERKVAWERRMWLWRCAKAAVGYSLAAVAALAAFKTQILSLLKW